MELSTTTNRHSTFQLVIHDFALLKAINFTLKRINTKCINSLWTLFFIIT